jgi:anti-sigma regulatory factor (Ser/Thr protein kinase)
VQAVDVGGVEVEVILILSADVLQYVVGDHRETGRRPIARLLTDLPTVVTASTRGYQILVQGMERVVDKPRYNESVDRW